MVKGKYTCTIRVRTFVVKFIKFLPFQITSFGGGTCVHSHLDFSPCKHFAWHANPTVFLYNCLGMLLFPAAANPIPLRPLGWPRG